VENVGALFGQLPDLLDLPDGQARVTARFREGKLSLRLRLAEYKIPASSVGRLAVADAGASVSPEARQVLERIARLLHRDAGETELVAEYKDRHLRSFDRVIEMELEL
jgi:hypothetical protein